MTVQLFRIRHNGLGDISTMARPRGGDWLVDEMSSLRESGVTMLVSLLTPNEVAELDLVLEPSVASDFDIEYISVPVIDRGLPQRIDFERAIGAAGLELSNGGHVAAHRRMGIGRPSLFAAGLLVGEGVSEENAWQAISEARGLRVPDTEEQRRWLSSLRHDT